MREQSRGEERQMGMTMREVMVIDGCDENNMDKVRV